MYSVTISNGTLSATILSFGARLSDLRLEGHPHSLVLGLPAAQDHLDDNAHMGGIAGPVANRIAGAAASLKGKSFKFEANEHDMQTLHGGYFGTSRQFWQLNKVNQTTVHATIEQPDMALGFPGNRSFSVLYKIFDNRLMIHLSAQTDIQSWCNLAPHPYFNLDGSQTIRHHNLQLEAAHYLPVDDQNIPTGEMALVEDSHFDFRKMRSLSDFVDGALPAIDHNYCLDQDMQKLRPHIAHLQSEMSGIEMRVSTDQLGVQLYFGQFLAPNTAGQDGKTHGPFSGICLEPQGWPDAPNRPDFPSVEISPDQPYLSASSFSFFQNS